MADVTFGVKVPEEMKEELSELMKSSTLSGKEFMGLLLSSYKLENKMEESDLFDSDLKELQSLMTRVQNLYRGMIEKSKIIYDDKYKLLQSEIDAQKEKGINSTQELEGLKKVIEEKDKQIAQGNKKYSELENTLIEVRDENKNLKQQLKNNILLHTKFEEEIATYKNQTETISGLQKQLSTLEKSNVELTKHIGDLNEEVKFSKYELKKSEQEIVSLKSSFESQKNESENNYSLKLNNELLMEKIKYKDEEMKLKEQINNLIQKNYQLEKSFNEKIDSMKKNK